MTKDMADSSAPMRCSADDGSQLPHNAARSADDGHCPSCGSRHWYTEKSFDEYGKLDDIFNLCEECDHQWTWQG